MDTTPPENITSEPKKRSTVLVISTIILLVVFFFGLKWILSLPREAVGSTPFLLFDYAVGLTMIFLPCTLPLAFVIVPLAMGKSFTKGIGMALSFGVGVTITLGIYGLAIGSLGRLLGIDQVETTKNVLYAIAGLLALGFALGELGLIRFRAPALDVAVPGFVQRQKDVLKAGFLGLFLGNVGVGCPNPLFNGVIIPQIVATGSAVQGFVIMVVQALGRVTPLLILAFLAVLGVNATSFLVRHKDKVAQLTGWATVFVGSFLFVLGFFGHDWWVVSGQHTVFEMITQENFITNLLGEKIEGVGHAHGVEGLKQTGLLGVPTQWGTPVLLFIWIAPMFWYWWRKKKSLVAVSPQDQAIERSKLNYLLWIFIVSALFLAVVFGRMLPHQFTAHWSKEAMDHEAPMAATESDFHPQFSSAPESPQAGQPFDLIVTLHDAKGNPIQDLEISHERIVHVMMASEDLKEFKHVHPEDAGITIPEEAVRKAEFRIPVTLQQAGRYRILVNAASKSKGELSATQWFSVGGEPQPISIDKNFERVRTFDGYTVTLASDLLRSGEMATLRYLIQKGGAPVTDLEPYLAAPMHLAIVSVDLNTFLHTHGGVRATKLQTPPQPPIPPLPPSSFLIPQARANGGEESDNQSKEESKEPSLKHTLSFYERFGPEIEAQLLFPHPGLYKIYGQFQHQGRVILTEFMLEVLPGPVNMQAQPHAEGHSN